jgi:hypothetical protein
MENSGSALEGVGKLDRNVITETVTDTHILGERANETKTMRFQKTWGGKRDFDISVNVQRHKDKLNKVL